jgi:hypothetical protein
MSIGWPGAIVLVALIFGGIAIYGTVIAARAAKEDRVAKVADGDRFRELAQGYETLAQDTREAQVAIRADIAALQRQSAEAQAAVVADVNRLANSVESIETMMRDVG